jgi:hypothetical protein
MQDRIGQVDQTLLQRTAEAIAIVDTRSILTANDRRDNRDEGNGQRDRDCDPFELQFLYWKVLRRICAL